MHWTKSAIKHHIINLNTKRDLNHNIILTNDKVNISSLVNVIHRLSLIPAIDQHWLADETNDSVFGQNYDTIHTSAAKGVAMVNFLQLLLVSRQGLLTSISTC